MTLRIAAVGCLAPLVAALICGIATPARADLVLETETAQIGKKGEGNLSNALQIERDSGGKTYLTETQLEYGINDKTEILIEPFFYEKQFPKGGPSVQGMGDVEVTLSYMVITENGMRPAFLIAQKIKFPTATHDIGTGKADYTSYVIIGKTWGEVQLNINLGYQFTGKIASADLKNQFIWDASLDFPVAPKTRLYAEAFGNSSPESGVKATQAVSFGVERQLTKHVNVFTAVGDDTDHVKVGRIGLNYGW